MALQIQNTLSRKKEPFVPADPEVVRIYTCGLTVYSRMHIGHARTYCFWDVFRRYLEYCGYHVVSVINYTDIDDRIMDKATTEHGCQDVAESVISSFRLDCRSLRIKDYSAYTRATDFVPAQIEAVADLIERGHAYVVDGEVLYSVESFSDYGCLSGNRLDSVKSGASERLTEDAGRKRHPADFTLWKPSGEGQPSWPTGHEAWPSGRPGWHIECSVMSRKLLGEHFDVHGGAVDNLFPHHENEIAQSQPVCGNPWVKYWMHPEHLDLSGVKMSKSLGNVIDVPHLLSRHDYAAIRWFFLSSHYRTKLAFSDELLDASAEGFKKIRRAIRCCEEQLEGKDPEAYAIPAGSSYASLRGEQEKAPRERDVFLTGAFADHSRKFIAEFRRCMDDDVGTAQATAAIFDYVNALNAAGLDGGADLPSVAAAYRCLTRHLYVLGIEFPREDLYPELAADCFPAAGGGDDARVKELSDTMDKIVAARSEARKAKDFAKADMLRDLLGSVGVEVEDTADGPRWTIAGKV